MTVIPFERRRRRSSNAFEAITLQLEYILEEAGMQNFVLGDDRGLLVAHAGRADDAHVLAAYAPVVAKARNLDEYWDALDGLRAHIPEVTVQNAAFRTFEVDGHVLHLALVSRDRFDQEKLFRTVSGVKRILGESRAVA